MSLVSEEGVLRDVLDELDRERSRRAELESKVRKLQEESSNQSSASDIVLNQMTAKDAEITGYRQIVDALTLSKPAVAEAAKKEGQKQHTLPVHVIRLLEVIPWDPRAQQHIFVTESIYEWNIYKNGSWQEQLRLFPTQFRTLKTVKTALQDDRSLLFFLAGGELQQQTLRNKNRVLTNDAVTCLYDPVAGFPLPNNGGTWEWVGGWQTTAASVEETNSDTDWWSYAADPRHFFETNTDAVLDHPGQAVKKQWETTLERPFRRRKWTRVRVLVDYPFCCESTQKYLRVLAENAKLSLTTAKVSQQLADTKATLTETEQNLITTQEELKQKETSLQTALAGTGTVSWKASDIGDDSIRSTHSEGARAQDFGTKITQLFVHSTRKASEDLTSADESDDEKSARSASLHGNSTHGTTSSTATSELLSCSPSDKFDWKKIGQKTFKFKNNATASTTRSPFKLGNGKNIFRKMSGADSDLLTTPTLDETDAIL